MVQRFRGGYTSAEKTEMWDRWQRGESLSSIGRAFGKESKRRQNDLTPVLHRSVEAAGVNRTFLMECPNLGPFQTWRRHAWNGQS